MQFHRPHQRPAGLATASSPRLLDQLASTECLLHVWTEPGLFGPGGVLYWQATNLRTGGQFHGVGTDELVQFLLVQPGETVS